MAFEGRGEHPSFHKGEDGRENGDNSNFKHGEFWGRPYRRYIVYNVPLDNTYVLMSMIITFLILIVGGITYLISYESTIIDPIADLKKAFINAYSVVIIICLFFAIFNIFKSKEKEKLLKNLTIILIFSILAMVMYLGIKLYLDTNYTESAFEQFYSEQNQDVGTEINNKISIEFSGVSIKTDKEYYIDECVKLYNIFKIKTSVMIVLHLIFNILLIFIIIKEFRNKENRDKADKDAIVLFDEEQNVKI